MTYNCVRKNNRVHQLHWLENKMCCQIDDSSYHLYNYSNKYGNFEYYDQINWLENKMCRQLDDSYLPGKNELDKCKKDIYNNYVYYDRFNWLENKMFRQSNDGYLPAKNDRGNYGNKCGNRDSTRCRDLHRQAAQVKLTAFSAQTLKTRPTNPLFLFINFRQRTAAFCHECRQDALRPDHNTAPNPDPATPTNLLFLSVNLSHSTIRKKRKKNIVDRPSACFGAACFHAACFRACGQATFEVVSNAALTGKTRMTYLLYLLVNFDQLSETSKNRQSFFDWRTKQKPSRRAGFVITAIRDSPGLIGGG